MAKRLLEFDGKLLHAHAVSEAIAQDAPSHGLADLFFKVDGRLHRDQRMAQTLAMATPLDCRSGPRRFRNR